MPKRRPAFDPLEVRLCLSSPTLQTAFELPQAGSWTSTEYRSSPIFYDIFGTGKDDLIAVAAGAQLVAYAEGANGSAVPVVTYQVPGGVADIKSTPIVVVDPRTGQADLFAGMGRDENDSGTEEDGRVFGWNLRTGQILPGWANGVSTGVNVGGQAGIYGALTSGVLGTDGLPDIVATSFSHNVVAITLDAQTLWSWTDDDTIVSGAVIGDIDRTGVNSVIVGGDSSSNGFYQAGGWVNVLSNDGILKWRHFVPGEVTWSSPVLGDLLNNGNLDIVIGTGLAYAASGAPGALAAGNYIYALDPYGNLLPGWPYHTTNDDAQAHEVLAAPAVVDLLGNGQLDVVAVDRSGYVDAVQPDGQALPAFVDGHSLEPEYPPGTLPDDYGSVIVADVTGSGQPEIIAPYGPFLDAIDANGNVTRIATTNYIAAANSPEGIDSAAAVGHFDGGSAYTLAFVADNPATQARPDVVSIFALPATNDVPAWPMIRKTAAGVAVTRSAVFDQAFVVDAFNAALGFLPDATTLANFEDVLNNDTVTLLQDADFINQNTLSREVEVYRVFQKFLGINPDPNSLTAWTNYLANDTYRDMETLVASGPAFAQHSGYNYGSEITNLYEAILGRAPSTTELNYWVSTNDSPATLATIFLNSAGALSYQLSTEYPQFFGAGAQNNIPADASAAYAYDIHHGLREEDIDAGILATNGQYGAMNTLDDYTRDLYRDILKRQPAPSEVAGWLQAYDAGTVAPSSVAGLILNSQEARVDYVQQEFQALLGRLEDTPDADALANYSSRESLILTIVGSPEYYNRNGGTQSSYVTAIYRDLGGIDPIDQNTINGWLALFAKGSPITTVAQAVLDSTLYDNVTAVQEIFEYLPDESLGVLRTANLPANAAGQPVNPSPTIITYMVDEMQAGETDEQLIATLLNTPDYDHRVTYYKGILRSPGIRD